MPKLISAGGMAFFGPKQFAINELIERRCDIARGQAAGIDFLQELGRERPADRARNLQQMLGVRRC
jgi:hypothetical protein